MLQTQNIRLFLRLSLFWCICCSLFQDAEMKAVTERMVRSYEDLNNNTQSEFCVNTLKLTLVKLETEISRLKEINEEKDAIKQLKSDLNDLQLKYFGVQKNLTECRKSKNNETPPGIIIKGLREQMMEDIKSKNWSRSAELMKKHVDNSTLVYEQLNNVTQFSSYMFYSYPLKAAQKGYKELIQVMLDNGLPINKRFDKAKPTMLHATAFFKQYKLAKYLIRQGAEVNVRTWNGATPLHWAAMNCDVDIVQLLLDSGADINDTDNDGKTPLHWAAKWYCELIVQYLINKGCDTTISTENGETAADVAGTPKIKAIITETME